MSRKWCTNILINVLILLRERERERVTTGCSFFHIKRKSIMETTKLPSSNGCNKLRVRNNGLRVLFSEVLLYIKIL